MSTREPRIVSKGPQGAQRPCIYVVWRERHPLSTFNQEPEHLFPAGFTITSFGGPLLQPIVSTGCYGTQVSTRLMTSFFPRFSDRGKHIRLTIPSDSSSCKGWSTRGNPPAVR